MKKTYQAFVAKPSAVMILIIQEKQPQSSQKLISLDEDRKKEIRAKKKYETERTHLKHATSAMFTTFLARKTQKVSQLSPKALTPTSPERKVKKVKGRTKTH